jgi:tRNA (adenine37-N6)-methyltransferase
MFQEVVMHPIFPRDSQGNIKIKPIGYVRSPIKEPQTGGLTQIETEIVLSDDCGKCLDGIEEFSHVVVIYWLDRITAYRESCHPQGREDVPLLGMLATR